MSERPKWIEPVEGPGFRVESTAYWSWEGLFTGQPNNHHRVVILQNTGVLYIGGRTIREAYGTTWWDHLGWNDPTIRELYAKTVAVLREKGIEIPGPDPKFQRLESLVERLVLDESTKIDLAKIPLKPGTPIALATRMDTDIFERDRTSKLIHLGIVGKHDVPGAFFGYRVFPGKPFWTIEYNHFTPDEQHVTGVFEREHPIFMGRNPQLHILSGKSLEEITREAKLYAAPEPKSKEGEQRELLRLLSPIRS